MLGIFFVTVCLCVASLTVGIFIGKSFAEEKPTETEIEELATELEINNDKLKGAIKDNRPQTPQTKAKFSFSFNPFKRKP